MDVISDFQLERSLAARNWDLTQLIEDLEKVKSNSLSFFEENSLYGLLCRYNLSHIASKLGWSIKAVRTELSRGLYIYLKDLLDLDKIAWCKVADWLEPVYGKQIVFPEKPTYRLEEKNRSSSLIALVLADRCQCKSLDLGISANKSDEMVTMEKYADMRLKAGNAIEAVEIYREVLEKNTSDLTLLNKIGDCLYELGFYNDVAEIGNFVLCHTQLDEVKSIAYNLLGSISRENAIQKYSNLQVDRAIYYFTQVKEISATDVLPAWSIVETLLHFRADNANYLQRAKLAVLDFFKIAEHPESTFPRDRERILQEAAAIFADLDEWWQDVYDRIASLN
jgi:tetratricopeptide (TPR) repeat protein